MLKDIDDILDRELVDEIIQRGPACIEKAVERLVLWLDAPLGLKREFLAELEEYWHSKLVDQRAMDEYRARMNPRY